MAASRWLVRRERPLSAVPAGARIHFACVIGGDDVSLFPHLVRHYRAAGVESFLMIRQAETVSSPSYRRLDELARAEGVEFFHSYLGPYSLEIHQRLLRHAMDEYPDDWFVIADSDEFHVYDRPLPELVSRCEDRGHEYVGGCLLDRVGEAGVLAESGSQSLWESFPLAGCVSAALLRALPLKVAVARGSTELLSGQHGAPEARGMPAAEGYVQIHHFKWTASVLRRLEQRTGTDAQGRPLVHDSVTREARRFLAHVARHQGRINVADPAFRLHPCGTDFGDHPEWDQIVREAQAWRWTLL